VRCALADSMLGGNGNLVRNAPLTLVYLADREPAKLAQSLMALESSQGADSAYVSSLPSKLSFLLGNGIYLYMCIFYEHTNIHIYIHIYISTYMYTYMHIYVTSYSHRCIYLLHIRVMI
jgi:hypothetical protein